MRLTQHRRMVAAAAIAMTAIVAVPTTASAGPNDIVVNEGDSIQLAIDVAKPGARIIVKGHHAENVWIHKSDIKLVGRSGASIELPADPTPNPCSGEDPDGNPVHSIVCVFPPDVAPDTPPWEIARLRNVAVKGLTVTGATISGIDVFFTDDVVVKNNSVHDSLCEGIFVLFADGFKVQRNVVTGTEFCDGIAIPLSENGRVSHNTVSDSAFAGIGIGDTSNVVVSKNHVTGNCIGITAVNNPDPFDAPATNVRIVQNTANANNTVCYPFDPPGEFTIPVGVTGILAAATDRVVIERNTASDNVTDEFTITAAGIYVTDFEGTLATRTRVNKNTAFGNSSAAGPVDLWLDATGGFERVNMNHCDYSQPDASWCTG